MKKVFDTDGNLACMVFENSDGTVFSTVKKLSSQLVAETVFNGKTKANRLRIYLDGESPNSDGSARPCLRVEFNADGKTIVNVSLLNDPEGAELNWKR